MLRILILSHGGEHVDDDMREEFPEAEPRIIEVKFMKTDLSPSFDPRNKVVSFRLSDNEYECASDFCKASGFRGMSMLARSAFLAYLPQSSSQFAHQDDPAILQAELKILHSELARLIASLSKIREHIATDDRPNELAMAADNVA